MQKQEDATGRRFEAEKSIDIVFLRALLDERGTSFAKISLEQGKWRCLFQVIEGIGAEDQQSEHLLGVTLLRSGVNLSAVLGSQDCERFPSWAALTVAFLEDPLSVYNPFGDLTLVAHLFDTLRSDRKGIDRQLFEKLNGRPFDGDEFDEKWLSSTILSLEKLATAYSSFRAESFDDAVEAPNYNAKELTSVFERGFAAGRMLSELRKLTHINRFFDRGVSAVKADDLRGIKGGNSQMDKKSRRVHSLMQALEEFCRQNRNWRSMKFKSIVEIAGKLAAMKNPKDWHGVAPRNAWRYVQDHAHGSKYSDVIQHLKSSSA